MSSLKHLQKIFQSDHPPGYIYPLLWLRGESNETEDAIRNQIRKMHEIGACGFVIESRPHKQYLDEGWWRDLGICIDEAKKLSLKVWIFDEEYYPSGIAGGRVLQKNPQRYRMRVLVHHADRVTVNQQYHVKKEQRKYDEKSDYPTDVCDWEKILSVRAFPVEDGGKILFDQGLTLRKGMVFDPPSDSPYKNWVIDYVGITPSWSGRYHEKMVDFLNPEVSDEFIQITYEQTRQQFEKEFGKTILGFFGDETSFENFASYDYLFGSDVPCLPWTRHMLQEFERRKNYDLRDQIHLLWYDVNGDETKIRYDYMDVLTRLFSEHFFQRCKAWCHRNGVQFIGHIIEDNQAHAHHGYGPGHFFRATRHFDMGGYDLVLRQLVPGYKKETLESLQWDTGMFAWTIGKLAHSVAHLEIGTEKVMCENYGAYGWSLGLRDMKWLTDWQTVRGTNIHMPHAFSLQFPDEDCPPHFYADGNNPQWPFFSGWGNYVNRCALMLHNAVHKADVLVLYPAESHWAGDPLQLDTVCRTLLQGQIDFDIISMDLLVDENKSRMINGSLNIEKESFSAIIVPPVTFVPESVIRRLQCLSDQGISIVFTDKIPTHDVWGNHENIQNITAQLEKKQNVHTLKLDEVIPFFQEKNLVSLQCKKYSPSLRYYQVKKEDRSIFFLFNESIDTTSTGWINFRQQGGKIPELWDPLGGTVEQAILYRRNNNDLELYLNLRPYQSIFVVFQQAEDVEVLPKLDKFNDSSFKPGDWLERKKGDIVLNKIDPDDYTVLDDPVHTKAETPFTMPEDSSLKLGDWSLQDGFDDFSGTVSYIFQISINESGKTEQKKLLDLGEVWEIARVFVNGVEIGLRICPPYTFIISGQLTLGTNEITIEVTNTLGNRIKDQFQAREHKPSGLLGPVRIYPVQEMNVTAL